MVGKLLLPAMRWNCFGKIQLLLLRMTNKWCGSKRPWTTWLMFCQDTWPWPWSCWADLAAGASLDFKSPVTEWMDKQVQAGDTTEILNCFRLNIEVPTMMHPSGVLGYLFKCFPFDEVLQSPLSPLGWPWHQHCKKKALWVILTCN